MSTHKKPWPRDAIMITCATPELAKREQMESVNDCQCRECGKALVCDGRTYRRGMEIEAGLAESAKREPRPIMYFCVECCCDHQNALDIMVDHRGGKSEEQWSPRFEGARKAGK